MQDITQQTYLFDSV